MLFVCSLFIITYFIIHSCCHCPLLSLLSYIPDLPCHPYISTIIAILFTFSPLSIVINHKYHLLHHPFMYPMSNFIIVVIYSSSSLSSVHLHHHFHPFTFVYCRQSSSSRYLCSQRPLSPMDQNPLDQNTQIACNGFSHAKTPCMRYH